MDTSEQYVKMCDCGEVQGPWEPKKGDYYFPKGNWWHPDLERVDGVEILNFSQPDKTTPVEYHYPAKKDRFRLTEHGSCPCSHHVFLPRQDQIQEWLGPIELHELLDICSEPRGIMWKALHEYAESFEQLWLAFYMYEKHGKVWNGEEWAKSDGAKGLRKSLYGH